MTTKRLISDNDFFPPIIGEDNDFALKIKKEYDVPFDELCLLIREIRWSIHDDLSEIKDRSEIVYDMLLKRVFDSDARILKIDIVTNKGSVSITKSDIFLNLFSFIINRAKYKLQTLLNSENSKNRLFENYFLLHSIFTYFNGTSLNKFQQRVSIGMFLVHFKLGKPVMTEEEFNANPTGHTDYKHYLNDIVKSRLKKYLG